MHLTHCHTRSQNLHCQAGLLPGQAVADCYCHFLPASQQRALRLQACLIARGLFLSTLTHRIPSVPSQYRPPSTVLPAGGNDPKLDMSHIVPRLWTLVQIHRELEIRCQKPFDG